MRDTLRAIEANIRHLQCLLSGMLLDAQVLDIRLAEMTETKVGLSPHASASNHRGFDLLK